MDKFNDVEYRHIPTDEECFVTAVKIGDVIEEPASTIRKWAEYHEDNLYIKKINGRYAYTQRSIEQFQFIKKLKKENKMTHEQIKIYMEKHGTKWGDYSNGLINPDDPFGYEVLSVAIAQQTENKLKEFMTMFVQYQKNNNVELINTIKSNLDELEQNVDDRLKISEEQTKETIRTNNESVISKLNDQEIQNVKILNHIESIQKEIAKTKDMNEKLDNIRESMEKRKNESSNVKKSIWNKLFRR